MCHMVIVVCMVGHDYQRILDGIEHVKSEEPVEWIYLVYDNKEDKYGLVSKENANELEKTLSRLDHKIRLVNYNPQSYGDAFRVMYQILKEEVDKNKRGVLIDTTSTTKESYGATVTVALMFRNVRIFIVPPRERGWYSPSPESPNFRDWLQRVRSVPGDVPQEIHLPGDRLQQPNKWEMKVVLDLERHGGFSDSISALIEWHNRDPRDPVTKNQYGRLIRRLEDRGLVKKDLSSRKRRVSLTAFGKVFAQAVESYEAWSTSATKNGRK